MAPAKTCFHPQALVPEYVRDLFLSLAYGPAAIYQPVWSSGTLTALGELLLDAGDVSPEQWQALYERLEAWPRALQTLEVAALQGVGLSDDNRDVLAVATAAQADTIVTPSPGDFASDLIGPLGVFAYTPDTYLLRLFLKSADDFVQLLAEQAAGYRPDLITGRELLRVLALSGAAKIETAVLRYRRIEDLEELVQRYRDDPDGGD